VSKGKECGVKGGRKNLCCRKGKCVLGKGVLCQRREKNPLLQKCVLGKGEGEKVSRKGGVSRERRTVAMVGKKTLERRCDVKSKEKWWQWRKKTSRKAGKGKVVAIDEN
jgi:hypothetical protein